MLLIVNNFADIDRIDAASRYRSSTVHLSISFSQLASVTGIASIGCR